MAESSSPKFLNYHCITSEFRIKELTNTNFHFLTNVNITNNLSVKGLYKCPLFEFI